VAVVAALASGWVAVERRVASPMVDLRMLTTPALGRAYALTFVITACLGLVAFLIPQLLAVPAEGYGFGVGTTEIGLFLLPGAIAGAVSDSVGGFAARRFGPRAVVRAGMIVTAGTMLGLAFVHTAAWHLTVARVLIAFAAGLGTTALLARTASTVDAGDTGTTTGLLVVTRVIGTALGAQAAGLVLATGADPITGLPSESAFVTGFGVVGVAAACSLFVVRRSGNGARA
jgi:predicted MFS family arabinose efflux permease